MSHWQNNPDVVVIGAGIIGAACALRLSQAGLKVLVLDRGSIAGGTTGAGEGNILLSDKAPGAELTLAIRSRNAWFEIVQEIDGDFELEAKGGIVVSRSQSSLLALARLANLQRGAGVEVFEPAVLSPARERTARLGRPAEFSLGGSQ